jgi:GrpB-like predicted nucleotidyltransferase (UPF0157 family)
VIEHVGSTAVPGLASKPIVDVDVVVPGHEVPAAIEALARAGYVHQGDLGIGGREAFTVSPCAPYHHLYVVTEGSQPHRDHIDLRDFLRRNPEHAEAYARLKYELATLLKTDRDSYVSRKGELIADLLRLARR